MERTKTALLLLLAAVSGVAHADGDRLCRAYMTSPDYFSHPAAIEYIRSGAVEKGFEPKFSREYYAAILGRFDDLAKLLAKRDKKTPLDGRILDDTVSSGETRSLELLLAYGLSPDHTAPGDATPIMYALQCNEPMMLSYLLAAGADVYWHNATYGDAMSYAIVSGSVRDVRLLLLGGFDPDCASYDGSQRKPEALANRLGNADMVQLLSAFRDIRAHAKSKRICALPASDRTPLVDRESLEHSDVGGESTSANDRR